MDLFCLRGEVKSVAGFLHVPSTISYELDVSFCALYLQEYLRLIGQTTLSHSSRGFRTGINNHNIEHQPPP